MTLAGQAFDPHQISQLTQFAGKYLDLHRFIGDFDRYELGGTISVMKISITLDLSAIKYTTRLQQVYGGRSQHFGVVDGHMGEAQNETKTLQGLRGIPGAKRHKLLRTP